MALNSTGSGAGSYQDEGFEDESSATPTLLSAGTGASVPDGGPGAASSADCVAALVPEPAPTPAPEPVPEPVDEPVDAGAPAAAGLEPGAGQDTAAPGTLAAELPAWAVSELRAAEEAKQELLRVRKELEQAKTQLQAAACQQTREEEAELARKLVGFYAAHKVTKTHEIPKIAKDFVGRESELNKVLRLKYGKDLDTFQSEKAAGTLAGLEGAASRKSPVASTVQTRKQSVSPPSARPPAPRAHNRPSSAMGSRPHVAKKEGPERPRSAPLVREAKVARVHTRARVTLDQSTDGDESFDKDIRKSVIIAQRAGRAIDAANAANTAHDYDYLTSEVDVNDEIPEDDEVSVCGDAAGVGSRDGVCGSSSERQRSRRAGNGHLLRGKEGRGTSPQGSSSIRVYSESSVSAYSDFRVDGRQSAEDARAGRAVYAPRQASLRLDSNPRAMRPRPASAMSTISTVGGRKQPSSRPTSAMSDRSGERGHARCRRPLSASTERDHDAVRWVPDGEGGGWERPISGTKERAGGKGWWRKNVHTEIVEQELQSLARLLHLPPKKEWQSLEKYAHELRMAAENGTGHYSRSAHWPPPSRQVAPSLDFLYKNTGYPTSGSASSSVSGRRSRPSSGKLPRPSSAHSSRNGAPHESNGGGEDRLTPLVSETGLRELYLGQGSHASPPGAVGNQKMEARYMALDTAYMTSALDYWDARYLSLVEVMQRAKGAKKKANKFIVSSKPADANSSTWYSPDGSKGPLAPWVPKDRLASRPQSASSARRSLNLTATSTSHTSSPSKAPFASSAARFPDGMLLDEARYCHGVQTLDVAPKIPPSSFGKQVCSHRMSPPRVYISSVPRPSPQEFQGLDKLHSAPEISAIPRIYFPKPDQIAMVAERKVGGRRADHGILP